MPAIAERLPAKYLVKAEAPKIIASREQHEAYIQRLLELQRKAHRSAEETETAKLLSSQSRTMERSSSLSKRPQEYRC
jgi:hypothetical protein